MTAIGGAGYGAAPVAAHETPAYSHDSSTGETNTDWMAPLPNALPLSHLSIPGTHDSGAYVFGGDSVETQSMSPTTQLNAGIRVWDIRLGTMDFVCPGPALWIFHGFVCQSETFDEILDAADGFLAAHPGETVLMRVKHEFGSSENFAERVQGYLDLYGARIYTGSSDNPTLGEVRGKIVILQNFDGPDIGIPWGSLNIQDNYQVDTNWDLVDKWHDVRDHFVASETGSFDTIYVNFLSAAGGSFPYFIASGHSNPATGAPRLATGLVRSSNPLVPDTCSLDPKCIDELPSVNCALGVCTVAFEGVNILSMNYINASVHRRAGIVMADFPGRGLISAIINLNPWNNPPVADAGGPYAGVEGSALTFDASASSDLDGDPLTYRWDFDSDGTWDTSPSFTPTASFTWPDDHAGTVTVEVSDGNFTVTDSATVTVDNLDPVIASVTSDGPITTGSSATITVHASDAGGMFDPLTYQFDCDNDDVYEVGPQPGNATACDFGIQEGTFLVKVRVDDDDGGWATGSVIVEAPTFLCVNAYTGAARYVDLPPCTTHERLVTLSESQQFTVCTSRMTGQARVALTGDCGRFEIATVLPAQGPLHVCVSRYTGLMRAVTANQACVAYEFRRIIGTPLA